MPPPSTRARGRPRAFNNTSDATHIRSLERAIHVLKAVSEGEGLSLTEIALASGESTSTTYRALLTMQKFGLVEFVENGQLWQIGVEAFRIGNGFLRRTSIVEESRPVMQQVMIETGETANLAVIDKDEVVFVSQVETHQPIRAFFRPGTRGPIHASGIGKALLAFMPEARLRRILGQAPFEAFTSRTITDPDTLEDEMRRVRDRGWAVDDEERTDGMRCVAAPIFDVNGEAIAGISISGPSGRVDKGREADLGAIIAAAARQITESIGGRRIAL